MVSLLIGMHATFGEIAAFAFLWTLVELIEPSKKRIDRAKIAASIGVIFIFLSWIVGGYYYVNYYKDVKPIIKEGPAPWAHGIAMETKEHIFLFLPFLAILTNALIRKKDLIKDNKARRSALLLSGLIFLLAIAMAGLGFMVSSGARAALESTRLGGLL